MKNKLIYILILALIFGLLYVTMWKIGRWFNYSLSYKSQVKETVCEMIERSALKNPDDC